MKRVVVAATTEPAKSACIRYARSAENFIKDARRKIAEGRDPMYAIYSLERAEDHLKILKSRVKSVEPPEVADEFLSVYTSYMSQIQEVKDEIYYKEHPDEAPLSWETLNGSEQYAVELAKNYMKRGKDLESAAQKACSMVNDANAESEYANESFYMEEADVLKVIEYLKSNL